VPTVSVTKPATLDDSTAAAVRALVERVAHEDGRVPLSDQALTELDSSAVRHTVARDGDAVVGYAQRDGVSLEIVALPEAVDALLDALGEADVRVWSHGRRSRLATALRQRGLTAVRELHRLRMPLSSPIETAAVPDGVTVRAFVTGVDEDAWVQLNAVAFASHPEQGKWTRADLEARERESWFDPSGFLMAWRDGELVGFHWTKIHPDGAGEVYVIGVAPTAQGLGLGRVLLELGLASLQQRGCRDVLLYTDGDNTRARHLYERTGFGPDDLDVQWATGPA
jgi:mycothiol synthase